MLLYTINPTVDTATVPLLAITGCESNSGLHNAMANPCSKTIESIGSTLAAPGWHTEAKKRNTPSPLKIKKLEIGYC